MGGQAVAKRRAVIGGIERAIPADQSGSDSALRLVGYQPPGALIVERRDA